MVWRQARGLENSPGEGPGSPGPEESSPGRGELTTSQDSVLRWAFWREEGLELWFQEELGLSWLWVEVWLGLGLGLGFGSG